MVVGQLLANNHELLQYLPIVMATDGYIPQQQQDNNTTPVVQPTLIGPVVNPADLNLEKQLSRDLQACHSTVLKIRNSSVFPARIHKILKNNQELMSSYLVLFQAKFGLKKLLSSIAKKLSSAKSISLKLSKKVSLALANH